MKMSDIAQILFTTWGGRDQSNKPLPAVPPWVDRDLPRPVLGRFGPLRTLEARSNRR